jgi:hypothetical protein
MREMSVTEQKSGDRLPTVKEVRQRGAELLFVCGPDRQP